MANELSAAEIDRVYSKLKDTVQKRGYYLNPDVPFVKALIRGLLTNQARYGYWSCPCRLASGKKEEDRDIICPCDYRDPDVKEFGTCYCALYVSKDVIEGKKTAGPIPERRPPRSERIMEAQMKPVQGTKEASAKPAYPVWRCTVCGYLCAMDAPPDTCPICQVSSDRFDRFM